MPGFIAEQLRQVREPLQWCLRLGERAAPRQLEATLRRALLGPALEDWEPPDWLFPHQIDAAKRIAGSMQIFGGALLCDAVGLGKTYVGLAAATRYTAVAVLSPGVLVPQWKRVGQSVGVPITVQSHESLSRRKPIPPSDLIIVDEAHRFRNTSTTRYDTLARGSHRAHILLLTATPIVNKPRDLLGLMRLFAPDHAFGLFGVRSLEQALHQPNRASVITGLAPAIIARSPDTAGVGSSKIPNAIDQIPFAPPPLPQELLDEVLTSVDHLEFPSFQSGNVSELLRMHIHHRLSSSASACIECLRRHRTYLERAIAGAKRGEPLSRRESRRLFGLIDEDQLALDFIADPATPLSVATLDGEQRRVCDIIALLEGSNSNPKAARLRELLIGRRAARGAGAVKTIVFCSAVATAHSLAATLKWHRTAVVTGRGARIASGAVSTETALALFAPFARKAPPPSTSMQVDVLIATDLVSEGLNLQDANAVVHFDLPWNPLRLQQRIGRIARLGSLHEDVDVWWFVPPPELERRLRLRDRIKAKVAYQRELGVAVTSAVGTAKILGKSLEARERHGASIQSTRHTHCFAVVHAPNAAVFALRWTIGPHSIPDLLAITGSPPEPVTDFVEVCELLNRLLEARPAPTPPAAELQRALAQIVRVRLSHATLGPMNPANRRLVRAVLHRAAKAGTARRVSELDTLDAMLDELTHGVRLGAERELDTVLRHRNARVMLRDWLGRWGTSRAETPIVTLEAAIFGNGTGSCRKA